MNTENHDSQHTPGDFILFAWWRIAATLIVSVGIIWGIVVLVGLWGASPETTAMPGTESGVARAAGEGSQPGLPDASPPTSKPTLSRTGVAEPHQVEAAAAAAVPSPKKKAEQTRAPGRLFVETLIQPLSYELEGRFWGWRPNDIIRITDNVNNMQLGVLEVTRRATVNLAERISRTGTASELNRNLESAMNLFMVKSDSFLFPSAEQSYKEALAELSNYSRQLGEGKAKFYTRTDNLIPLLRSFADLLGSCDENLVKLTERDGSPVSTFAADNYFYYGKGVAGAIVPILQAVAVEFKDVLGSRGGDYTLKQAIRSCEHAAALNPLIVLEGSLDGIFANHRANMAAHISHARFYLDVLANTLST